MKCERCGRPLKSTSVEIKTRFGPINYGPKCARKAGLLTRRKRTRVIEGHTTTDVRQMALELAA